MNKKIILWKMQHFKALSIEGTLKCMQNCFIRFCWLRILICFTSPGSCPRMLFQFIPVVGRWKVSQKIKLNLIQLHIVYLPQQEGVIRAVQNPKTHCQGHLVVDSTWHKQVPTSSTMYCRWVNHTRWEMQPELSSPHWRWRGSLIGANSAHNSQVLE